MLKLVIDPIRHFDPIENKFVYPGKEVIITLEHSLVALSKWEAKWCKPFLSTDVEDITDEEMIDYIKCMTITQNVKDEVYTRLTSKHFDQINKYIAAPMTATTFSDNGDEKKKPKDIITNELIYYWMVAHNIPPEYQKWHLNRLLTLINVCNIKNQPEKKKSKIDSIQERNALNEQRLKKYKSRG